MGCIDKNITYNDIYSILEKYKCHDKIFKINQEPNKIVNFEERMENEVESLPYDKYIINKVKFHSYDDDIYI